MRGRLYSWGEKEILSVVLILASIILISFSMSPSIDHDEGFFALGARHYWSHGHIGFYWTDVYYGKPEVFFPLNSLPSLINLGISRDWSQSLFGGRALSIICVLLGAWFVFLTQIKSLRSPAMRWVLAASLFLSLPLWIVARMVRPDAEVFLTAAVILSLFRLNVDATWREVAAGALAGIAILAHAVFGLIITAMVAMLIVASRKSGTLRGICLSAIGGGAICIPFYSWYINSVGLEDFLDQVRLFIDFTPRSADQGLSANAVAWAELVLRQSNWLPLLSLAALALVMPAPNSGERSRVRAMQILLVAVFLFWIFVYPRKALSPAVIILPLAISVLAQGWPKVDKTLFQRLGLALLVLLLIGNLGLSVRYHLRLVREPSALTAIKPIEEELRRAGIFKRQQPKVMSKLWLSFVLPPNAEIYDITLFPNMEKFGYSGNNSLVARLNMMDAVILENVGGVWVDDTQEMLSKYYLERGWGKRVVHARRLFQPVDLVILLPPHAE